MLFQLIEQRSFMHSLNPMAKFLGIAVAVVTLTLFFAPLPTLFMLMLALVLLLGLARLPLLLVVKSTLPFVGLAFGLAWINVLFSRHGGANIVNWGVLQISEQSLRTGTTLGLRVLTIVLFSYLFAATTNPRDLALSMVQQARLPYKLAFGLFAGFRFLTLLETEWEHIRAAHRMRGAVAGQGWRGKLHEFTRLTIPLFASVIRKAGQIGIAMESKGFGAYDERTYLHATRVTWRDGAFLAGLVIVLATAGYVFVQSGYLGA